jgi:hypothetical protein
MKLSVFGEYCKFTVVGPTRTRTQNEINCLRRMYGMKLSTLGENGD